MLGIDDGMLPCRLTRAWVQPCQAPRVKGRRTIPSRLGDCFSALGLSGG